MPVGHSGGSRRAICHGQEPGLGWLGLSEANARFLRTGASLRSTPATQNLGLTEREGKIRISQQQPPVADGAPRRYPLRMAAQRILVLGSRNRKKLAELAALLEPHGLQLKTLDDFAGAIDVVEDGQTFDENAAKKAVQQAQVLRQWVLGEDSGLVVDALNGEPGVLSARFSGPAATDETNNSLLLKRLAAVPSERRTAHYVCHMTLADPSGLVRADCEAICRGRMRDEPAGTGGFGYDPLFEVIEYRQTFGELGSSVKGMLSHRGRAVRQMVRQLVALIHAGAWDETPADASAK